MAYCFMTIGKVKTLGALHAKYNHNYRLVKVENAAPELKCKNEELIKLPVIDGKQLSYDDVFRQRIASLPYYRDHKVYKTAVPALEIVMSFSKGTQVELEKWKEQNVKWLKDTFNVAPDGKDNVISVTYHADEAGEVHCHAIVIPIDERGHLCASRFTDGSRIMSEHQTTYANYMKDLGLQRGLEGSTAKHKDIRKFYAELNQSLKDIPEPLRDETAIDYLNRTKEEIMQARAAQFREILEKQRKSIRKINTDFNTFKKQLAEQKNELDLEKGEWRYIKEETGQLMGDMQAFLRYMTEKKAKMEQDIKNLEDEKVKKEKELQETIQSNEKAAEIINLAISFEQGMESYSTEDPEGAQNLEETIQFVVNYDANIKEIEKEMEENEISE